MARPVAITGLGILGSFGYGAESLARALRASTLTLTQVDRSAGYHLPGSAESAALVDGAGLGAWVNPAAARRMSVPSRFAVAAAGMALRDAGTPAAPGGGLTAVILSTSYGPTAYTERLLKSLWLEGPESASPSLFTECVANAPAAQVAIACQATGSNISITQREAGPLLTLARGADEVASGRVERALVGAAEEAPPLVHAFLDRFHALSRSELPRPFDRCRDGFVLAEGAAVLVLEDEERALGRGGRVLARVRAWGSGFDPTASRTGWGVGHRELAASLRRTLRRSGLAPADLDLIVSGASGAVAGDRLEALWLRSAWEDAPLPPVVVPKAVTGEYGGGFLASAVLAAGGAELGPGAGFREADPELGIIPHAGGPLPRLRRTLATSLAAGGAAAWAVLERA